MKITCNWLSDFVDVPWEWPEMVERLTLAGLEVEVVHDLAARYEGIVVGHVAQHRPHPNAERLSICEIDVGVAKHPIVCGAPNVAVGQKVPVILHGKQLPDGTEIRRTDLRGIVSEGVICSEVELALGTDNSGIMVLDETAQTGAPFATETGLDDVVIEFEVTPNRSDCLSLLGIAREIRALTGNSVRLPPRELHETGTAATTIDVDDVSLCPRYVGRVVSNVRVGPSPAWLQHRLRAIGQRPVNNVVDITNYVMLELGQPLHAFDLDRIEGNRVVVRLARCGEIVTTLDGTCRTLHNDMLVVADSNRPVAIAGIIGGTHAEISESSVNIFLECAFFAPDQISATRRTLGLQTEASMRFERGTDVEMLPIAVDRAAHLLATLAGGRVAPGVIDMYPRPLPNRTVTARVDRINQLLSLDLKPSTVAYTLHRLGCNVTDDGNRLHVVLPPFRPDLGREVDLIEEIGRIYDYNRIPASENATGRLGLDRGGTATPADSVRILLAGLGLDEIVSNTIVENSWAEPSGKAEAPPRLTNPPTESQTILRPNLLPSLLDVTRRNFNRRARSVAIFELGKCFTHSDEHLMLAALMAGRHGASPWHDDNRETDLLDLKGVLEALLEDLVPRFASANHPQLRRGHAGCVCIGNERFGHFGQVATSLCEHFGIDTPVYVFELDFDALTQHWHQHPRAYVPLPKFPPIERDLAVVLSTDVGTAEVAEHIRRCAPDLIESVELFDTYQGEQIEAGSRSLAFNLRMRAADRTLEDREADAVFARALQNLQHTFGAALR